MVGASASVAADDDAGVCASLFRGLVFWISRECPREMLDVTIRSFGGKTAWEGAGSHCSRDDPRITHEIVDRPVTTKKDDHNHDISHPHRVCVQPQWVVDCANFRLLAPSSLYAPGLLPPPHLSPFVDNDEEGYTPDFAKVMAKLQQQAAAARQAGVPVGANGFVVGDDDDHDDTIDHEQLGTKEKISMEEVFRRGVAEEMGEEALVVEKLDKEEKGRRSRPGKKRKEVEGVEEEEEEGEEEGGAGPMRMEDAADDEEALEDAKKGLMTSRTRKFLHRIQESQKYKKQRVTELEQRKERVDEKKKDALQRGGGEWTTRSTRK